MKITLVRHAEVIEEYQGKYNGHIDISLSNKGKAEAKTLAKTLDHHKFDAIYCSDLLRAKQTLEAFSYNVQAIYTPLLREKSWGVHEGMSFEEIEATGIEYSSFEKWISDLGGEDLTLYIERVKNYFFEKLFKLKHENILVITHAGVIKTLLSIIQNSSLDETFSISLPYSSYVKLDTTRLLEFKVVSL